MAAEQSSAANVLGWLPVADSETPQSRRDTLATVRWALIIACAYLVLFSEKSSGALGAGPLVIAVFLATNLAIGRLRPEVVAAPGFAVGLAVLDTALIVTSLHVAGQLSVELVVLCLGVLILTIGGLRTGPIAAATMGMTAAYLLIVWLSGSAILWRSSMLLRVPFLLTAALCYAWLAEPGRRGSAAATPGGSEVANAFSRDLSAQREAIRRCQEAFEQGRTSAAQAGLNAIAAYNDDMTVKAAQVGTSEAAPVLPRPTVVRGAA